MRVPRLTAFRVAFRVLLAINCITKVLTRIMVYPRFSAAPAPGYTFNDRVKLWIKARRAISKQESFRKAQQRDIRHWPLEVRLEYGRLMDQQQDAMNNLVASEALGWEGEDLEE